MRSICVKSFSSFVRLGRFENGGILWGFLVLTSRSICEHILTPLLQLFMNWLKCGEYGGRERMLPKRETALLSAVYRSEISLQRYFMPRTTFCCSTPSLHPIIWSKKTVLNRCKVWQILAPWSCLKLHEWSLSNNHGDTTTCSVGDRKWQVRWSGMDNTGNI